MVNGFSKMFSQSAPIFSFVSDDFCRHRNSYLMDAEILFLPAAL